MLYMSLSADRHPLTGFYEIIFFFKGQRGKIPGTKKLDNSILQFFSTEAKNRAYVYSRMDGLRQLTVHNNIISP